MNDPADSTWRPTASLAVGRMRAEMLRSARRFFDDHDVLEVTTPALSASAVSDVQLESISATLQARPGQPWYLHTSPELSMKRLLCAGWPDIYQICPVFRDGEVGQHHQPEFTMVEWYRKNIGFRPMMEHTVEFLATVLDDRRLTAPPVYLGYREAFQQACGVDAAGATVAELQSACGASNELIRTVGDNRDDWLDLLLSTRVAATFQASRLTVLHHYPASQAALARLCPDDPRFAERFEVFFGELELANGYCELQDADEQLARCQRDQARRRALGRPERPLDEAFLAALRSGLPECCGVAVGFDRLAMINARTHKLREVQVFTAVDELGDQPG